MLVVGHRDVYLSHLPMFHGEHAAQVILQADLRKSGVDVNALYFKDRASHPKVNMYTLQPETQFVLSELFTPSVANPTRNKFDGQSLFRGHLERPGNEVIAEKFTVFVRRVVYANRLPAASRPAALTYVIFGNLNELFAAHFITQPPDFDQVSGIQLEAPLTAEELKQDLVLRISGRANTADARIRAGERIAATLQVGQNASREVRLLAQTEFYYEEGELRTEPTFRPTPLEKKSGF
jgi:hypothetical protein